MNSKPAEQTADDWIRSYDETEQAQLALVQPARRRIDFSPVLEQPTKQLLIVPTVAARDQLAGTVKGIACLAWEDGNRTDIAPLLQRSGREVFLWLDQQETQSWLGETLFSAGYNVNVIEWPGTEFEALSRRPWGELREWVKAHKTPWKAPEAPTDILPDTPPPAAAEPVAPAPAPHKRGNARERALREAENELARVAATRDIELRGKVMTIDDWLRMGLHITAGRPTANVSNISLIFDDIKHGRIWYDEFLRCIMTRDGRNGTRAWTGADDIHATIEMQRRCGVAGVKKSIVEDAVIEYAMRHTTNGLRDYIMGLDWDGTPRIDHAFEDLFDVPGTNYHREISRNFFKSLVARALYPGCKVDTMPVFEGEQGLGKSKVIEALGGPFYAVMKESPETKDFYVFMAGKWLIEIAELDAFSRADIKSTKRALSTAVDRFRPPYGKHALDHPRQCVFAGTVNGDDWNRDPTGARRFWPVACRGTHPDIAKANRDQYFAEAYHALNEPGGRCWWNFTPETADEVVVQQSARFVDDDWTNTVRRLTVGVDRIYPSQIYRELGFDLEKDINKAAQGRVAEIMKRIGWKNRDVWDRDSKTTRRAWCRLIPEG